MHHFTKPVQELHRSTCLSDLKWFTSPAVSKIKFSISMYLQFTNTS